MLTAITRLFRKPPPGKHPGPQWLDVADLRAQMASAPPLILDVRGADEFDGPLGHIEGARNIPLPELPAHQAEIAGAGRPVVCICLTDKRSGAAAAQLATAGVTEVSVLRGGMKAWREAGAP
ncbi:MAG: rhodanese-like domain-containing protein [Stellaceae bacterium]